MSTSRLWREGSSMGRASCGPIVALLMFLVPAIAAPAAELAAPTISELQAMTGLVDGDVIEVAGYRQAGDDGGGTFRYDASNQTEPDGGTVLEPDALPGRFVRLYDPQGPCLTEWFGAYGDGASDAPHDDQAAINACLQALGRVKLLAKTYGVRGKPDRWNPAATYHAIDLGPGYRIEGSGRDRTVLKLLSGTNPHGNGPSENYFNLLGNRDFYESADHIVVRDLTIDCNFDNQDKHTTINAVAVRGGGALLERLNLRGYGTGRHPENGSSRECFAVYQTLVYKARGSRQAATCRDLDFTACGHNGDVGGSVAEITHIALGGADNFDNKSWILPRGADPDWDPANNGENENNWWPSYGGVVEDCVLHDESYDPAIQQSPLNGITYGDCIGVEVRRNRAHNWEGTGVYVISWWNRDCVVADNDFDGVYAGVALQASSLPGNKPNQCPSHIGTLVERNRIVTGPTRHCRWSPLGIQLFGGEPGPAIRFRDITVRRNTISGRAFEHADGGTRCPTGIVVQIVGAIYQNLSFEENTIDCPDFVPGTWVPQEPHSLSMMFYPLERFAGDLEAGNVVYRNNRNPQGKELYPALAGWDFKNTPTYGKPTPATE